MTPACLENIVSWRGCTDQNDVLAFIDDLPNMRLNIISSVADERFGSIDAYVKRIVGQALQLVADDMISEISSSFTFMNTIEVFNPASWSSTTAVPPNGLRRGLYFDRNRCQTQYACLFIESLIINVAQDVALTDLEIIDGHKVYNYNIGPLTAFEPVVVPINLVTNSQFVKITLNETLALTQAETSGSGCGCANKHSGVCYQLDGWDGVSRTNQVVGIQANASVRCCIESLLCLWRREIANLVAYRAGLILATELLTTARVNEETLNTELAQTMGAVYTEEYNKKLQNWAKSSKFVLASLRDRCITCNQSRYLYAY